MAFREAQEDPVVRAACKWARDHAPSSPAAEAAYLLDAVLESQQLARK